VLIAIMGTVSAHGTPPARVVAAPESAAANQATARADAATLLDELSLPSALGRSLTSEAEELIAPLDELTRC
jgi:antitoxin (DNA-binding transcriptional repressor) of toxin-antitoxin stability system